MCENFLRNCAKHLLLVLNVLFLILGIGVLGLGTWLSVHKTSLINMIANVTTKAPTDDPEKEIEKIDNEVTYYFTIVALIIIGMGAFIVILSLVGCFGAIKESKCLLIFYAAIVIFVTLSQSIGIIVSAIMKEDVQNHLANTLNTTLVNYYGKQDDVTKLFNRGMEKHECCGMNGFKDFQHLDSSIDISPQCCRKSASKCNVVNLGETESQGCLIKFFDVMENRLEYAIIVAAVIIVTEILGIALALGLNNTINTTDDDPFGYDDDMQMRNTNFGRGAIDSVWPS